MLALLLILPLSPIQHDRCDLVEVNHFFDEQGRPVFDQVIWYDWHADDERHHVVAWRLVGKSNPVPERDWQHGGYTARWQDGEVRAMSISEYELNGVDCDPPKELERLRAMLAYVRNPYRNRLERCRYPLLPCPLKWNANMNDTTVGNIPHIDQIAKSIELPKDDEPAHIPEIVRDVRRDWAADKCCECGKSLEHENTIHIHAGNAYCSRCYHAENA